MTFIEISEDIFPDNSLFSKMLDYTSGVTDSSKEFILTSLLAGIGVTIGNNAHIKFGGAKLFPNLYIIKVAGSSRERKTTSDRLVTDLLNEVCPKSIFPDDITPEMFQDRLADNPNCLLKFTEIGGVLKKMEKQTYLAGMKTLLTDLYDSPLSHVKQRKGKKGEGETSVVSKPTINILGSSTIDWLSRGVTFEDIGSGFLPRFQFSYVTDRKRKKIHFPNESSDDKKQKIVDELNLIKEKWKGKKTLSKDALNMFVTWSDELDRELDTNPEMETLAAFYDRIEKAVIKIGIICEAVIQSAKGDKFVNSKTISEEAMALALEWGNYFKTCVSDLLLNALKVSKFDKDQQRILRILKKFGGTATQRVLTQYTKIYGAQLRDLLEVMEELGLVTCESVKTKGGTSFEVQLIEDSDVSWEEL